MDLASFAQTAFAGISNGALYALLGLGFSLVIRSTGLINFAQGDLMMVGAILTGALCRVGLPVVVSAPLAIAATTVLSAGFYWFAIRPAAGATMAQVVLLTIGFAICLRGVVTMAWGSDPMMVPSFTGEMPLDVAGVSILPQELWLIGVLVVITLATGFFFRHTVMGLALRAGATNPLGASFVGIDPRVLGLLAFAASGFLGAVAGAVWSPISFAQVDVGLGVALKGFTAAILGGLHSNYGPILGGIVLALIELFWRRLHFIGLHGFDHVRADAAGAGAAPARPARHRALDDQGRAARGSALDHGAADWLHQPATSRWSRLSWWCSSASASP